MIKAAVSVDNGYHILVTEMERTWYCSADEDQIKGEKKVRFIESDFLIAI